MWLGVQYLISSVVQGGPAVGELADLALIAFSAVVLEGEGEVLAVLGHPAEAEVDVGDTLEDEALAPAGLLVQRVHLLVELERVLPLLLQLLHEGALPQQLSRLTPALRQLQRLLQVRQRLRALALLDLREAELGVRLEQQRPAARVLGLALEDGLLVVALADVEHLAVEVQVGDVEQQRGSVRPRLPPADLQRLAVAVHRQLLVPQLAVAAAEVVEEAPPEALRGTGVGDVVAEELLVDGDRPLVLLQAEVAVAEVVEDLPVLLLVLLAGVLQRELLLQLLEDSRRRTEVAQPVELLAQLLGARGQVLVVEGVVGVIAACGGGLLEVEEVRGAVEAVDGGGLRTRGGRVVHPEAELLLALRLLERRLPDQQRKPRDVTLVKYFYQSPQDLLLWQPRHLHYLQRLLCLFHRFESTTQNDYNGPWKIFINLPASRSIADNRQKKKGENEVGSKIGHSRRRKSLFQFVENKEEFIKLVALLYDRA